MPFNKRVEIQAGRPAANIIETPASIEKINNEKELDSAFRQSAANKMIKLKYDPNRNIPTSITVKSIHSYRVHSGDRPVKPPNQKRRQANEITFQGDGLMSQTPSQQPTLGFLQTLGNYGEESEQKNHAVVESAKMKISSKDVSELPVTIISASRTIQKSRSSRRGSTEPEILGRGKDRKNRSSLPSTRSVRSKSSVNTESQLVPVTQTNSSAQHIVSHDSIRSKKINNGEQRSRRLQNQEFSSKNVSTRINREEIKKRLDELRRNTMAILTKNVQKARKKSNHAIEAVAAKQPDDRKLTSTKGNKAKTSARSTKPFKLTKSTAPENSSNSKSIRKNSDKLDDDKIYRKNAKIGLLRKSDSNLIGEQQMDFEKWFDEKNVTLEFSKPRSLRHRNPSPSQESRFSPNRSNLQLKKSITDLELIMPDLKLKSRPELVDKATQFKPQPLEKPGLAYWLQPTPVQPYPYNFIMAVRKKLQAVTNPVQRATSSTKSEALKTIAKRDINLRPASILPAAAETRYRLLNRPELNEISSINFDNESGHKLSTASSVFTAFINSPEISQQNPSIKHSGEVNIRTKSHSDVTSSLTINLPHSNTISEASSFYSELVKPPKESSAKVCQNAGLLKNSDDTTAPSSVFSSPEKRRNTNHQNVGEISPLSTDCIGDLNLWSKPIFPMKEQAETVENFELMLEDFNRSLSQAIEINQQLDSVLSKSPRSNQKSVKLSNSDGSNNYLETFESQYSSDFEKASSKKSTSKVPTEEVNFESSDRVKRKKENKNFSTSAVSTEVIVETEPQKIALSNTESDIADKCDEVKKIDEIGTFSTTIDEDENVDTYDAIKVRTPSTTENESASIKEISEKFLASPDEHNVKDPSNISTNALKIIWTKESKPSYENQFLNNKITSNQISPVLGNSDCDLIDNSFEFKTLLSDNSIANRPLFDTSLESEVYAIFGKSELEQSISESNQNYSSLGMYDQLIKNEMTKSEHLAALLKIREKSILDRTRGQIALLEIQKEKCKEKGLTVEISIIKRKQRALLLKMEKEREDIKRFLVKLSQRKAQVINKEQRSTKIPCLTHSEFVFRKSPINPLIHRNRPMGVLRENETLSNSNLELILSERENELQRRRKHVEHLLEWHQRLDKEEEEVTQIEKLLYEYNEENQHQKQLFSSKNDLIKAVDRNKRNINEINRSIRELKRISSAEHIANGKENKRNETVRISGRKLNGLWRRLTGRNEMRYDPRKGNELTKEDLERLYEDAKLVVLQDFEKNVSLQILEDRSKMNISESHPTSHFSLESDKVSQENDISNLNLNFSSDASELEKTFTKPCFIKEACIINCESDECLNESSTSNAKSLDIEIIYNVTLQTVAGETMQTEKNTLMLATEMETKTNLVGSHNPTGNNTESKINSEPSTLEEEKSSKSKLTISERRTREMLSTSRMKTELSLETNSQQSLKQAQTDTIEKSLDDNDEKVLLSSLDRQSTFSSDDLCDSVERHDALSDIKINCTEIPSEIVKNRKTDTNSELNSICLSSNVIEVDMPLSASSDAINLSSGNGVGDIPETRAENKKENLSKNCADYNDQSILTDETFEETMLEDISEPKLEITDDDMKSSSGEQLSKQSTSSREYMKYSKLEDKSGYLEKRLIELDESLRSIHSSLERALSPDRNIRSISPSNENVNAVHVSKVEQNKENHCPCTTSSIKMTVKDYLLNPEATTNLMPDIINEVEFRRRQHILAESDIMQLESSVPYALLREIPNKPPPPYVPPAHGSPMTTIFPSEMRIKEITFRRTKELYEEMNEKGNSSPDQRSSSILDENITNIYERMILDICKESICVYQPIFVNNSVMVGNYKMPLALYNPPNRLKCIQEFVYKRVRRLLSMDKQLPRNNAILSLGRKKRDCIDEIIVQELFEEDRKWTNFDLEEAEVRASVVEEVFNELVQDVVNNFEIAYKKETFKTSVYE